MKTNFIFLLFMIFGFTKAQVAFTEGFENTTLPTGWSTSRFVRSNSIPCVGSYSLNTFFNAATSTMSGSVTTAEYISNGKSIDFSFQYRLQNTNNDSSPSAEIIVGYKVGTNVHSLDAFTTYSTGCQIFSGVIPSYIVPEGSHVKIIIEVNRKSGYFNTSLDHFVATQDNTKPVLRDIGSNSDYTSAAINYTLLANNFDTTSVINYGTSTATMTNQVIGLSATGNTATPGSFTLNSLAENTTYYYRIVATNSTGTTSSDVLSFKTKTMAPIAEYKFDNTLNNTKGTRPFADNSGISFVDDRFGAVNKAMHINGTGTSATITDLPAGNSSRTISFWIKPTQINATNDLFSYGLGLGDRVYFGSFYPNYIINNATPNSLVYNTTTEVGVWKHLVYMYNESTKVAKIYVNGVLGASGTFTTWNAFSNNVFNLGSLLGATTGKYVGAYDDLKIYPRTLSDNEVEILYSSETLGINELNKNNTVKLYPNPVKDILIVKSENKLESVEVFSLNGQKIITTQQNNIDVSKLASGVYIIKITNKQGKIETQKIIKK
ncbi:LamG-like jellyroll fold domain-containing protein [Cloacibacterium sp.]|uniref:LamG-like jellyroll fold domain-containing protein n=1 Tax=Cloacibacterium sp. TaxID=1913682 RepID=UPI0039E4B02A